MLNILKAAIDVSTAAFIGLSPNLQNFKSPIGTFMLYWVTQDAYISKVYECI